MARHLNHDIVVDKNTGKAKVMSQNISGGAPITRLQKGDIVTFSSTDPNSEIRYKDDPPNPPSLGTKQGSPFPGQLAPKIRHRVDAGTHFMVETECDLDHHFVFECGHDIDGDFSEWGVLTRRLRGGNTPGPDA